MNRVLCSLFAVLAVAVFAVPSFGDSVVWPDVSSSVTGIQTNLSITPSGSDYLWVTSHNFTNSGSQNFSDVQVVDTAAYACLAGDCNGTGPGGTYAMTWDNALQEWQLTEGSVEVTVQPFNSDFSLSLDPLSTNITIPGGLSTSDSMPAFDIGALAAGGTTSADVDFLIGTSTGGDVSTFFYGADRVGQLTPEPATLALLGAGLLQGARLRRKLSGTK